MKLGEYFGRTRITKISMKIQQTTLNLITNSTNNNFKELQLRFNHNHFHSYILPTRGLKYFKYISNEENNK